MLNSSEKEITKKTCTACNRVINWSEDCIRRARVEGEGEIGGEFGDGQGQFSNFLSLHVLLDRCGCN